MLHRAHNDQVSVCFYWIQFGRESTVPICGIPPFSIKPERKKGIFSIINIYFF